MIIGLTGGIASGKSVVSKYLVSKDIPIVDADLVARDVVLPGSKGLNAIVEAFGQDILENGQLNRKALRSMIFSDDDKRLLLNSILHPIIHEEIVLRLSELVRLDHRVVVFEAPLLLENHLEHMVDELWVVSTSFESQVKRVMKRDMITEAEAKTIIKKQMPLEEKIKKADVVLNNDGTIEELYHQIDQILEDHH